MTKPVATSASDSDFYLPADRFFAANLPSALTFDDVSLATLHSEILPKDTDLATTLAEGPAPPDTRSSPPTWTL
jgi:IMP dehydrogenase